MASIRDTLTKLLANDKPEPGTPLARAVGQYPFQQGEAPLEAPMFSPDDLIGTGIGKAIVAGGAAKLAPLLAGHIAWHGSPHAFTKFELSKLGTGEGAQAFGHGMYFAENPEVAKSYVPRDFKSEDKLSKLYNRAEAMQNYPAMEIFENLMLHKTPNELSLEGFKGADLIKAKNALQQGTKVYQSQKNANLYKVDIPDEHLNMMLHWDKPLSEQPTMVKQALEKYDAELYHPKGSDYDANELGQSIYSRIANMESTKNPNAINGHALASDKLNNLGVKGIKYLDEGSRTSQAGTNNFVIFDPSNVKVLERNQKLIDALKQQ